MTSSTPKNMQYKNISGSVSTSQKSDGCQAKMKDGRKCGETKNLQIIQEFKRLYESKMQQIDDAAGGDCVQAKINLQREWINDLTDQNEMLVRVVEELEVEAAERVTMLEEKLENSAKCACENEKAAKEKDKKINELEERIKKINEMAEKNEEARKSCHQYAELKKSMLDMREALTAEVAEKHDTILYLRRDIILLEDQCKQADQQTHFKDDIIKELRREIKHLKAQKSKISRSPRTVKRCDQSHLHSSNTDPEANIRHLKDGTVIIKDTETVGDTVVTQTIKEKYSDPCNQTIVYICESVPLKQKSKSRENSRVETSPSPIQPQEADSRNCEVSLDDSQASRCRYPGGSAENSRDLAMDFPRDGSEDVSRDSASNLMQKNSWAHPSIHETCIRYSKDILNMLNNHPLGNKKTLGEYPKNIDGENVKSLNVSNMNSSIREEQFGNHKLKEETKKVDGCDSSCFLSESLNRCEKYFFDMFQKKCKLAIEKAKSLDEAFPNKYSCDCKRTFGDSCINLEKYEVPKNCSNPMDVSLRSTNSTNEGVCCVSSAVQTGACCQHNKDTQTNEIEMLCETNSSEGMPKMNDSEHKVNIKHQFSKSAKPSMEEIWNNANTKSDDVSFDEAELRGFSSPYHDELPAWHQTDNYTKFEQFYPEEHMMKPNLIRQRQTHRFCEFPSHKVPLVPIKRYHVLPPQFRQSKVLSPRTMRKIPRRPTEVPLSLRSRSLPTCADIYSRHDLQRPARLHTLPNQHGLGERAFVDVAFVMDDRNYCGKLGRETEELHDFVELRGREAINGRRLIREDCFDNMNNTY